MKTGRKAAQAKRPHAGEAKPAPAGQAARGTQKRRPTPRTERARLMARALGMSQRAIKSDGPNIERCLGFVVDMLAEGVAAMRAAPGTLEYQAALANVWCGMCGKVDFVAKWTRRVRGDKGVEKLTRVPMSPAETSNLVHGLLADALAVVGVHRPKSYEWIKGLPLDDRAQISVLTDFVVKQTCWDANATTDKAAFFAEYLAWLDRAKSADPKRYGAARPLTLKALASQINLSLATSNTRPERKGEKRPEAWKGIRLLRPSPESGESSSSKRSR